MRDSMRYALVCVLCALACGGVLNAQSATQDSPKSPYDDGTGFFLSLGAAKIGTATASNLWYQAPWESNPIDFQTGFSVGAKITVFNTKNTLGLELKGFLLTSGSRQSDQSDLKMLNYGGGLDGVWQPFKYLGVYAGGGYEQSRYADSLDLRATPQGGYANAGFRIGYQGLYLDLYYKYSLYQTHIAGLPSFSQSIAGLSVVFPLFETLSALLTPSGGYRPNYGGRGYEYYQGYYDGRREGRRESRFHF